MSNYKIAPTQDLADVIVARMSYDEIVKLDPEDINICYRLEHIYDPQTIIKLYDNGKLTMTNILNIINQFVGKSYFDFIDRLILENVMSPPSNFSSPHPISINGAKSKIPTILTKMLSKENVIRHDNVTFCLFYNYEICNNNHPIVEKYLMNYLELCSYTSVQLVAGVKKQYSALNNKCEYMDIYTLLDYVSTDPVSSDPTMFICGETALDTFTMKNYREKENELLNSTHGMLLNRRQLDYEIVKNWTTDFITGKLSKMLQNEVVQHLVNSYQPSFKDTYGYKYHYLSKKYAYTTDIPVEKLVSVANKIINKYTDDEKKIKYEVFKTIHARHSSMHVSSIQNEKIFMKLIEVNDTIIKNCQIDMICSEYYNGHSLCSDYKNDYRLNYKIDIYSLITNRNIEIALYTFHTLMALQISTDKEAKLCTSCCSKKHHFVSNSGELEMSFDSVSSSGVLCPTNCSCKKYSASLAMSAHAILKYVMDIDNHELTNTEVANFMSRIPAEFKISAKTKYSKEMVNEFETTIINLLHAMPESNIKLHEELHALLNRANITVNGMRDKVAEFQKRGNVANQYFDLFCKYIDHYNFDILLKTMFGYLQETMLFQTLVANSTNIDYEKTIMFDGSTLTEFMEKKTPLEKLFIFYSRKLHNPYIFDKININYFR